MVGAVELSNRCSPTQCLLVDNVLYSGPYENKTDGINAVGDGSSIRPGFHRSEDRCSATGARDQGPAAESGCRLFMDRGLLVPFGHDGYWTRPAYSGSHWVAPHHDGQRYFDGYWDGDHGQISHDHKWDKGSDHKRDFDRDHR